MIQLFNYFSVDTCVPGDMVTVSGVVKVTNSDEGDEILRSFVSL